MTNEFQKDVGAKLLIYFDGASKGNPGEAGAGVWIKNGEGDELGRFSEYLGKRTNNEAEYLALLLGLRKAKRIGARSIYIFTDSELLEKQIRGLYRVKDPELKKLHKKVIQNLNGFSSFEIKFIPREMNKEADFLANQAIKKKILEKARGDIKG